MEKRMSLLALFSAASAALVFATGRAEPAVTAAGPIEMELTKAYYFGEPAENLSEKEEYMRWVREKFNVDLKVNAFPRREYMDKLVMALSSGDIQGLGWVSDGTLPESYLKSGATLALNDFVKDNAVWRSLPEGMRTTNVRDGKLIALPSGWTGGLAFARSIRTDWLETLGLAPPKTIEQFYTVSRAFTFNDPDGNDKADTLGMTSSGVWNLRDIFMTFGLPTNHAGGHLIATDPHDGHRFNDGMLKPGAKPALEWLRKVYAEGILDEEIFTNTEEQMRDRMNGAKCGSTYYRAGWGYDGAFENATKEADPRARYDIILGLTSSYAQKAVNTGGVLNGGAPWVLISGTRNPEEQVNAFIDIFFGDEIGHWGGRYGVQGTHWEFGPNREIVQIKKGETDGSRAYSSGPGITTDVRETRFTHLFHPHVLEGEPAADSARRARLLQIEAGYTKTGFESGLLHAYPHPQSEPYSPTYRGIGAEVKVIFIEAVAAAVTGQLTVDEALARYRRQIRGIGGQMVLDEANTSIGKTSSAVYRY